MSTSVYICVLSKLVHASPGDWESALKAIEQKAGLRLLPALREAVILHCRTRGKKHDEIETQLAERARAVMAPTRFRLGARQQGGVWSFCQQVPSANHKIP
jgi:hypothetical protein